MFSDLILLQGVGNIVFFGQTGTESNTIVQYFRESGVYGFWKSKNMQPRGCFEYMHDTIHPTMQIEESYTGHALEKIVVMKKLL